MPASPANSTFGTKPAAKPPATGTPDPAAIDMSPQHFLGVGSTVTSNAGDSGLRLAKTPAKNDKPVTLLDASIS